MHRRRGRNVGRQSDTLPESTPLHSGLLGVVKTELGVAPAAAPPALALDGAGGDPREADVAEETCVDHVASQDVGPGGVARPRLEESSHQTQPPALWHGDQGGAEESERVEGVDAGVERCGVGAESVDVDVDAEGVDVAGFGVEEKLFRPPNTMGLGNRCVHAGCAGKPTYKATPGSPAEFCVYHRTDGMIQVKSGRCGQQGCEKYRSFGVPGTTKSLYCAEHALSGMTNVTITKKTCTHEGCWRQRWYGSPGGKAEFCRDHAQKGMVRMFRYVCAEPGCNTTPSYGLAGRKKQFCAKHGASKGMVGFDRKICAEASCTMRAYWGVKGRGPEFCREHAAEGMVGRNKKPKMCTQENCTKRPVFATVEDTRRRFCAQHAAPDMVDVVNRKCGHEGGCRKQPTHGVAGTKKRLFCAEHALLGLVNLHVKACSHTDCYKKATHGVVGSKLREFCAGHAAEGMAAIAPNSRGPRVKRARNVSEDTTASDAASQAPSSAAAAAAAATAESTGEIVPDAVPS